jgi:hypothetical protein
MEAASAVIFALLCRRACPGLGLSRSIGTRMIGRALIFSIRARSAGESGALTECLFFADPFEGIIFRRTMTSALI